MLTLALLDTQAPIMTSQGNQFKVVLLGDVAVGKTSLLNRYVYSTFSEAYQASIGMDFLSKTVAVGTQSVKLRVWDTAGQEKFRSLIPAYVRDAAAAVLLYDSTDRSTFESVRKWTDELPNKGQIVLALAANKVDLEPRRTVTDEEGRAKADELQALYFPISAAKGTNVEALFTQIATKLVELKGLPATDSIHLEAGAKPVRRSCKC